MKRIITKNKQNIGNFFAIILIIALVIIIVLSVFAKFTEFTEFTGLKIKNDNLLLGLIGLTATFYFGYLKNKIEHDKVFKELFDSFNNRYDDKMNDLINELRTTGSRRPLTSKEKNLVIDYFNLCAEEYLWKKKKRISDDVWDAWKAGIEENLKIPQINEMYCSEIKTPKGKISYYGINEVLEIENMETDLLNGIQQLTEDMSDTKFLFRLINNDTIDNSILSNVIFFLEEKLEDSDKTEIIEKNFHLFLATSPGCITKVISDNEFPIKRLIVIDKTLTYDLLKFNDTEIAAEILHEVGHVLNKEPVDKIVEKEFYADDFVRKSGLGYQLLNGLKKYKEVIQSYTLQTNKPFFKTIEKQNQIIEMFNKRIERIEMQEQILIGRIDN